MPSLLSLLALTAGSAAYQHYFYRPPSALDNIENVVVLVQENLSFDHFAGGLTYNSSIDGLVNTEYCNPAKVSRPISGRVCARNTAESVASEDPNHSITGINMQIFGTYHPAAKAPVTMKGFITEQMASYQHDDVVRAAEVIDYFTPDHIPIFNEIAQNYVLFDRWFSSVPGPTNPNRAYLTSGTSYGHGSNDGDFLNSKLPQKSIFEQLTEKGISWANYENSTKSSPAFLPDAMFYEWTANSPVSKTNILPVDQFYQDAREGKLPKFSWINPECCNYMSFHPPSPTDDGENFVKSIYEAVRNSPQWNQTLFILTFDEHGGFADHVPPPSDVPAGDSLTYTEKARDGQDYTFHFDRLGVRVPTVLISPWVGKGLVEHRPDNDDSEYTHTSILKFLNELWGLDSLSPRVDWSPSFSHLITQDFREDTPTHLPDAVHFQTS